MIDSTVGGAGARGRGMRDQPAAPLPWDGRWPLAAFAVPESERVRLQAAPRSALELREAQGRTQLFPFFDEPALRAPENDA